MNIDGISCDSEQLKNKGINPLRLAQQSLTELSTELSESLGDRESCSQAMDAFEHTAKIFESRLKKYCSLLEEEINQLDEARELMLERDRESAASFQQ